MLGHEILVAHYLAAAQPPTCERHYRTWVAAPKKTVGNLASNTRYLMQYKRWTQDELRKRAGLSQKTVSNVLNGVYDTKIETAEAIGRAFGLNGWLMISPYLVKNLESGGSIAKLLDSFLLASDEGQQLVLQIAEREAKYAK